MIEHAHLEIVPQLRDRGLEQRADCTARIYIHPASWPWSIGAKPPPMGMPAPPGRDPKNGIEKDPPNGPHTGSRRGPKGTETGIQVWSKTGSQKRDHFGRVDSEILNKVNRFRKIRFQKRFTLGLHFRALFGPKVFPKGS